MSLSLNPPSDTKVLRIVHMASASDETASESFWRLSEDCDEHFHSSSSLRSLEGGTSSTMYNTRSCAWFFSQKTKWKMISSSRDITRCENADSLFNPLSIKSC